MSRKECRRPILLHCITMAFWLTRDVRSHGCWSLVVASGLFSFEYDARGSRTRGLVTACLTWLLVSRQQGAQRAKTGHLGQVRDMSGTGAAKVGIGWFYALWI